MSYPSQFWDNLMRDLEDSEFREKFIDVTIQLQADHKAMILAEQMEMEKRWKRRAQTHDVWKDSTGAEYYVHRMNASCEMGCVIHFPSYHPLSEAPQIMREDKSFLIERVCKHGIGHPDPDSASFIARQQGDTGIWVHGCDGCCRPPKCYCGCEESEHMGKPRGCVKHGFHEYSIEKPKKLRRTPLVIPDHKCHFEYADDGNGHSGSYCECGKEEPVRKSSGGWGMKYECPYAEDWTHDSWGCTICNPYSLDPEDIH